MLRNIARHLRRNQSVDRLVARDARPNVGGTRSSSEAGVDDGPGAACRACPPARGASPARPATASVTATEQLAPAVPGIEMRVLVLSDHEEPVAWSWLASLQLLHRLQACSSGRTAPVRKRSRTKRDSPSIASSTIAARCTAGDSVRCFCQASLRAPSAARRVADARARRAPGPHGPGAPDRSCLRRGRSCGSASCSRPPRQTQSRATRKSEYRRASGVPGSGRQS